MDNSTQAKSALGVTAAVFGYLANRVNELMVVLAILMITDYILGITVAMLKDKFDPKTGVTGLIKKICYIFLVLLGLLLDYIITYLSNSMGLNFQTYGTFGLAITCYLIGNEGLSNLKSLALLGVPVVPFLSKGFGILKDKAETMTEDKGESK